MPHPARPVDKAGARRAGRRSAVIALAVTISMLFFLPQRADANVLDDILQYLKSLMGREQQPSPADEGGDKGGLPVKRLNEPPGDLFAALVDVSIEDAAKSVTVREGGTVTVRVVLSAASERPVSVGVVTDGGYLERVDELVTFAPGETERQISVTAADDDRYNTEPRFGTLSLVPPGDGIAMNARLNAAAAAVSISIIDDEEAPPPPPPPANLVADVSAVMFGDLYPGQTAPRTVLIRNTGGSRITLNPLRLEPRGGPFSTSFDECAGVTLGKGHACEIGFFYAPNDPGMHRVDAIIGDGRVNVILPLEGSAVPAPVHEDPTAAIVASLKAQRRAGQGGMTNYEIPPEPLPPKPKYAETDPDWGAIGIGRTYFSLPVDGERILTVDRIIPCVLEDTIRSELPGPVTCQVEQHVFAAGGDKRFVLIPAGTKVVGSYEGLGAQGDTRLNVIWQRFIRPDLSSVAIGDGFQGADAAGSTGIPGYVNKRLVERFATPVLLTLLTAGATALVPTENDQYASAAENLTEGIGDVATQLLEENLDIRPTMDIPAGTRLTIRPLVDLWFPRADLLEPAPTPAAGEGAARGGG